MYENDVVCIYYMYIYYIILYYIIYLYYIILLLYYIIIYIYIYIYITHVYISAVKLLIASKIKFLFIIYICVLCIFMYI